MRALWVIAMLITLTLAGTGCDSRSEWGNYHSIPTVSGFGDGWYRELSIESTVPSTVVPTEAASRLVRLAVLAGEGGWSPNFRDDGSVKDANAAQAVVELVAPVSLPTEASFEETDSTAIFDSLKDSAVYEVAIRKSDGHKAAFQMRRGERVWSYAQGSLGLVIAYEKYMRSVRDTPSAVRVLLPEGADWAIVRQPDGTVSAFVLPPTPPTRVYVDGIRVEPGVPVDAMLPFRPFDVRE